LISFFRKEKQRVDVMLNFYPEGVPKGIKEVPPLRKEPKK
jgi:hypothetical protein